MMFLEEENVIMTTLNTCDCTHQFDTLKQLEILYYSLIQMFLVLTGFDDLENVLLKSA